MTQMLKLLDKKIKITKINILWALIKKVDNMHVHMDEISRKMET